jgi:hypothetical protein
MLYAYGKIGRSIALTSSGWGVVGGDAEPPRLLRSLALRNPDDTFVIVSMCRDDPRKCGYPPNVVNSWTPERLEWYRQVTAPDQKIISFGKGPETLEAIKRTSDAIDSLYLPLVEKLSGVILWLGQHGTSNTVLPAVTQRTGNDGVTRPYAAFTYYAGGLFRLVNAWRDLDPVSNEETWLIADARNYHKARDSKWPPLHPVLGQFNFTRELHHERFGDPRHPGLDPKYRAGPTAMTPFHKSKWKTDHTWLSPVNYVYSNLEVCSLDGIDLPPSPTSFLFNSHGQRKSFGLFINEAGSHVGQGNEQQSAGRLQRAPIVRDWVLPLEPSFIHGKWTKASQDELGITVTPASWEEYFSILSSVKCTFTTPSSGSGWATTKPWEAFAAGTVCFRHPEYDTQDHIYGRLPDWAREWLSPPTKEDLWARVRQLSSDEKTWWSLIDAQYALLDETLRRKQWLVNIEKRMHRA